MALGIVILCVLLLLFLLLLPLRLHAGISAVPAEKALYIQLRPYNLWDVLKVRVVTEGTEIVVSGTVKKRIPFGKILRKKSDPFAFRVEKAHLWFLKGENADCNAVKIIGVCSILEETLNALPIGDKISVWVDSARSRKLRSFWK